jgi:hypothetical protein
MRAIVATAVLWGVLVASDIAADVAAVDAFLADAPKHLFGPPPEFGAATFHRRDDYEWTAVPIFWLASKLRKALALLRIVCIRLLNRSAFLLQGWATITSFMTALGRSTQHGFTPETKR